MGSFIMPTELHTKPVYFDFGCENSSENHLMKPLAVETIHPVRDIYNFRETVHIPGARCHFSIQDLDHVVHLSMIMTRCENSCENNLTKLPILVPWAAVKTV